MKRAISNPQITFIRLVTSSVRSVKLIGLNYTNTTAHVASRSALYVGLSDYAGSPMATNVVLVVGVLVVIRFSIP